MILFLLLFVNLAYNFIHTICEPLVCARNTKFQTLFRIVQVRTMTDYGKVKALYFFFK